MPVDINLKRRVNLNDKNEEKPVRPAGPTVSQRNMSDCH